MTFLVNYVKIVLGVYCLIGTASFYKVLHKKCQRQPTEKPMHLWSLHTASLSGATPITVCRFYTLCHFCANSARRVPTPCGTAPHRTAPSCALQQTPSRPSPALREVRYLADDLLRVHSSEVSACRGGFNDVGGEVLSDFVLRVCPTFCHNALRCGCAWHRVFFYIC